MSTTLRSEITLLNQPPFPVYAGNARDENEVPTPSANSVKYITHILDLQKVLKHAAEDIELHWNLLAAIEERHEEEEVRMEVFGFLKKQASLRRILNQLLNKVTDLRDELFGIIAARNNTLLPDTVKKLHDISLETNIFHEIHFKVKRQYVRLVHDQFNQFQSTFKTFLL